MEGNGRKANKARNNHSHKKAKKVFKKVQINRIPSHKLNK